MLPVSQSSNVAGATSLGLLGAMLVDKSSSLPQKAVASDTTSFISVATKSGGMSLPLQNSAAAVSTPLMLFGAKPSGTLS